MKKNKTDLDCWVKIMDCKYELGLVCDHYFLSRDDLLLKLEDAEHLLNKKAHYISKKWVRSGKVRTKWKS